MKTPAGVHNSALKSENGSDDLSFQLGTPGTVNTPMTAHTVQSMASSVGETYDNYHGDTWRDKDSVASDDMNDGMSFEQDSLNSIHLYRTPRDVTPLATINENSSTKGTGSSYKTKEGDDIGWLQGKDNSIGSFLSPYVSSKSKQPQSEVKESPQQSGNGRHHHHGRHHTTSASATAASKDAIKSKREYSAHLFLTVVTLLLAVSLVVHLSRHHDVVKVVEKRVPLVSSSPLSLAGWFSSPEQQAQKAIEENPTGWMDSITAGMLAKKSKETEKAKKEAAEKQKEIDRLEKSRREAREKAAARELEAERERQEALAKAAKEEAERKEAQRARLRAEQELAELEAKHAEEEKRHRLQEERRAKERKEEIARLEKERREEIERMKQQEDERVLVEAAKKAKAIHEAETKKKMELQAAKEAEKVAIAKAEAAKEAERKARRRRSNEVHASAFSWIATVLVILGVVASAVALLWSPFHSRTLKGLTLQASAIVKDLLKGAKAAASAGASDSSSAGGDKKTSGADGAAAEASEIDGDKDESGQQWKDIATPAPAPKKGGRGRSKTPARKAKTPAAKSTTKKRTPARSKSKGRRKDLDADDVDEDEDGDVQSRRGRTPLRRSGRVNHLESGNYIVD